MKARRHAVEVKVLRRLLRGGGEEDLPYVIRRESDELHLWLRADRAQIAGLAMGRTSSCSTNPAPSAKTRARWLYTGLTRAAHRITVVR